MSIATVSDRESCPGKDTERGASIVSLKVSTLVHGITLDEALEERLRREGHWLAVGTDQHRLELRLPGRIVVTPLVVNSCGRDTPWRLTATDGAWFLERGSDRHRVWLESPPSFYRQRTSSGRRVGDFAQLFGRTLVLGGAQACGYSLSGIACRFCRVGSRAESEQKFGITAHEAAEALTIASRERSLEHVLLPAASFDAEDGGVREIEPLVKAVRRHTSALVLAALHPPRTLRWIDHAYAIGVDGLAFNLEVPDVVTLERLLPGRARYLGRSRYYQALRHAGKIFPRGAVWTELLLGSASATELANFIQEFTSWGVIPLLVPVRPDATARQTPLPFAPTPAEVQLLLETLSDRLNWTSTTLPWLPEWPHLLGPNDALREPHSYRRNGFSRMLANHLALFAVRNLSRIRRSLRVRDLADHERDSSS